MKAELLNYPGYLSKILHQVKLVQIKVLGRRSLLSVIIQVS